MRRRREPSRGRSSTTDSTRRERCRSDPRQTRAAARAAPATASGLAVSWTSRPATTDRDRVDQGQRRTDALEPWKYVDQSCAHVLFPPEKLDVCPRGVAARGQRSREGCRETFNGGAPRLDPGEDCAMPSVVSVNVGTPARGGRGPRSAVRSIAKHSVTGAGPRRAARASTATRCPTGGTTAGSTRRCTPSPARTWTGGPASWAGDPGRAVRREPHHPRDRRQRGRDRRALADRRGAPRGALRPDAVQRLQELDGPAAATTTPPGCRRFAQVARPGPYLKVLGEGIDPGRRRARRSSTSRATASPCR